MCVDAIPNLDLIISMTDTKSSTRKVIISPFITEKEMNQIRYEVKIIIQNKRNISLQTCLSQLFNKQLFHNKVKFDDEKQAIEFLTQDVISTNYATARFTNDVFMREKISPTVFYDITIPHCLTDSVLQSFILFATCENPVLWANKQVSLIVLIGVTDESRRLFTEVFGSLINTFSNREYVDRLIKAANYDEFYKDLKTLIQV